MRITFDPAKDRSNLSKHGMSLALDVTSSVMSVMRKIRLPTAEEDAAIDAGIAADADTAELTDREFAELKPLRGRPRGSRKVAMTVRFDREVIDAFRATGRGWQTRMNQALREWLAAQRP